jgi:hypothetical protein
MARARRLNDDNEYLWLMQGDYMMITSIYGSCKETT